MKVFLDKYDTVPLPAQNQLDCQTPKLFISFNINFGRDTRPARVSRPQKVINFHLIRPWYSGTAVDMK